MLKNYLKIALRALLRQKFYAFLNVTGLALGLLVFLLIALFVRYHLGFESVHANADRLYRLTIESAQGSYVGSPAPAGPALVAQLPEIDDYVRFGRPSWDDKVVVSTGDRSFAEGRFFLADPSIFSMFTFPLAEGDPDLLLKAPDHVVLTASTALKYFGDDQALGQSITLNGEYTFTVVGVTEDLPPNTHLQFDFLAPFENIERIYGEGNLAAWGSANYYTYLLLDGAADPATVAGKINAIAARVPDNPWRERASLGLQPLTDIHFEFRRGGLESPVSRTNLYLFFSMGIFVLLIACINFINLSTARAMSRAREVGLRKALGAQRGNLIRQFLGESMVMTAVALAGAVAILFASAPAVSKMVDTPLGAGLFAWETAALLAGLAILVGLVSGSYPAFYLSSFQPARVLKNALPGRTGGTGPRSLLVIFQFGIATVLLVSSLVIFRQFDFMSSKDLGFASEQVVQIPIYDSTLKGRIEEIKAALVQQEGIRGAAAGLFSPTQYTFVHGASFEGQEPEDETRIWWMAVDYDLLDVMRMELVAGRAFSRDFPTDGREAYLLNETAVRALGWEEPLDKGFSVFGPDNMGRVVGVVKDFHYQSLHHEVAPFALKLNRMAQSQLNVRLAGRDVAAELSAIENVWRQFSPDGPFEYQFLDDEIGRMYRADLQARRLVLYFLLFSVFIACLGLFGLTAFTVEQRRKEIGIRKVLGATLPGIVALLSRDFVRLVAVAFVLAAPLAYIAMSRWLETFAYRIELSWEIWLAAGLLAVLVAVVTVGLQAARAAVADPVKSLRYE